ncbi:NAD(P)-binding protein [Cadophora sp. DSE1049]|nr:NAD(P)-binding protein [Cadophora sp. DSE1049]
MPPRIFATGTTGYVGGDILHALLEAHPWWEEYITCLARSTTRGAALLAAYPKIRVVYGDLNDSAIIEEEASKADIVLHFASSDHVGAASAIKRGMEKGVGGYWIHTSGTDILLNPKILGGGRDDDGEVKVYDDWDHVEELVSFPDAHSHRPCDKVVLSTSSEKVKTAIICPPTIWGKGRGSGSTRSHQIYEIARLTLEKGCKIQLLPTEFPKSFWPNIHIYDLARLYMEVIDSALAELQAKKAKATWNKKGYYFAENGVHYWQDVADWVANDAGKQGFLKSQDGEAKVIEMSELLKATGPAPLNMGATCKSYRAEKLFGWKPKEGDLRDEIANIVRSEAERAGLGKVA